MKRLGLQFSLLTLLVIPGMFALGWWARDGSQGHSIARLERSVRELGIQHQNDLLLDELRGEWNETAHYRGGVLKSYGDVDVEWLLAPEGGSKRTIMFGELETLDLGQFTVDTTKNPVWIDFRSRNGGRPFTCLGIIRVRHGFTDYGRATIALSQLSWRGGPAPKRPTSFEPILKDGVSIYELRRGP